MIVDDDLTLLRGMQDSLEDEEYHVVTARDGREAMRLVYSERPDLIILDIMMPRLDGWRVCRRVREMSDVPIIWTLDNPQSQDFAKSAK